MKKTMIWLMCLIFISSISNAQVNPEWMRYPAISPDGKTIAFSYKGDIYTVNASGGEAELLTSHPAYDYMPVWSPDSKTLAFASDRFGSLDVFTIPAMGGEAFRVTYHSANERPSSFTPDGKKIVFSAHLDDFASNVQFPSGGMTELYTIPVKGGRVEQVLGVPAIGATFSKDGSKILYYDWKGYEDDWRKHHTSAVTRDIWMYDVKAKKHTQLSSFEGENRYPVFSSDEKSVYFLTEQFGTFNLAKLDIANPSKVEKLTSFETHPLRFLSMSNSGTLAFGYHGEIYTKSGNADAQKVNVTVRTDANRNQVERKSFSSGANDMSVASNGKEIAFIVRGDVFVTSVDFRTTKQITDTPEQERSVDFSPDGKTLVYAGERNGSWNLYEAELEYPEEKYFHQATLIKETPLLVTDKETFQPTYSPDGKEVAFLEERTTLRVFNLKSKKTRTVLPAQYNYSYSDGDQYYEWSPDSKWFLVGYFEKGGWVSTDVGLVKASGKDKPINLTESGYSDGVPKWSMGGKAAIWFSDKQGYRSHGSWGAEQDVWAMFFDQEAYDAFKLTKEEAEYAEDLEKDKEEAEKEEDDKKKKKKGKKDDKKDESLKLNLDDLDDRKVRLTIHSSNLSDAVLTPDGNKLFYLTSFEGGYDLWVRDFKEGDTKLMLKQSGYSGNLTIDEKGKYLYMVSSGRLVRFDVNSKKKKSISFSAVKDVDHMKEREYMFEHAWRQVKKKFYDPNIHGLDWDMLKKEYAPKLAHINNNRDFSELLAELLGELNGSHTGSGYRGPGYVPTIRTSSLGLFFDQDYKGKGLKVEEIIEKGPFDYADTKLKVGMIIEKIQGETITPDTDYFRLLNDRTGKRTLVEIYNPKSKKRYREIVKPISYGRRSQLLYERWVEARKADVERLSKGRLGYVHVRGMNSQSFREVYSEALGRYRNAEALIVDTRFNGGGWLHDDLATFLNGKKYADLTPRGQYVASEPLNKWYKPSIVLISESNYSDAHGFPFAYRALGIGKTVGMPVPGTMTAVWWETLLSGDMYFGIPQVGVADVNGNYQENNQFEPDVKVAHDKSLLVNGRDLQLEKAVEVMLNDLK